MLAIKSYSISLLLLVLACQNHAMGTNISKEQFLSQIFNQQKVASSFLFLDSNNKQEIQQIIGRYFRPIRVRYWQHGNTTVWIFNEIGKFKPITVGIVLDGNKVKSAHILAFRESRGWEVRQPSFLQQFIAAHMTPEKQLSNHIDGITGATLSVNAVNKCVLLALYLQTQL